jgi:hypothetical protein
MTSIIDIGDARRAGMIRPQYITILSLRPCAFEAENKAGGAVANAFFRPRRP